MEIDYLDIGRRIKQRRLELGLSQERLAEMADLSSQHISRIESGLTKFSFPAAVALANALSVSLDKLYCGSIEEAKYIVDAEISDLLASCSLEERKSIYKIVRTVKDTYEMIKD